MTPAATREPVVQDEAADLSNRLHPDVARLHFGGEPLSAIGLFDLHRGSSVAVRLVGAILRLPPPARRVRLTLHIEREECRDVWHRSFGGHALDASFESSSPGKVIEGFGPLRLQYRMRAKLGALVLDLLSAHIRLGSISVRLPRWAAPRVRARAWVRDSDGLVHACIVVLAPWGDLLLAYRGYLEEVTSWTA
jgi:hypothetical protein